MQRQPQSTQRTSWRIVDPPPCLGGSTHRWVPVDTHSTPVPERDGCGWLITTTQSTAVQCRNTANRISSHIMLHRAQMSHVQKKKIPSAVVSWKSKSSPHRTQSSCLSRTPTVPRATARSLRVWNRLLRRPLIILREFKLTMKAARRKLEVLMPAAKPSEIPVQSSGETHCNIGKRKTKYACCRYRRIHETKTGRT